MSGVLIRSGYQNRSGYFGTPLILKSLYDNYILKEVFLCFFPFLKKERRVSRSPTFNASYKYKKPFLPDWDERHLSRYHPNCSLKRTTHAYHLICFPLTGNSVLSYLQKHLLSEDCSRVIGIRYPRHLYSCRRLSSAKYQNTLSLSAHLTMIYMNTNIHAALLSSGWRT